MAAAVDLITALVGLAGLAAAQGMAPGMPEVLPIKVLLAELIYPALLLLFTRVVAAAALAVLEEL
jgi:hypothetical protein